MVKVPSMELELELELELDAELDELEIRVPTDGMHTTLFSVVHGYAVSQELGHAEVHCMMKLSEVGEQVFPLHAGL
jgi:hypothetical protein